MTDEKLPPPKPKGPPPVEVWVGGLPRFRGVAMSRLATQLGEQLLHALWGAAPALLLLATGSDVSWWVGALLAMVTALPREIIDQWPVERHWDAVLDTVMFALGGALAGWVL